MLLALSLALLTPPQSAQAIPAFARKYRMSCTTCHAPFPKLKAYGDEFAGDGFVLKDQDAPRYYVETGDENLDLIRDLQAAFRLEGFVKHETKTDQDVDFTAPYNLKFLSGGALSDHLAYYFYFFFSERGEVAGIEDAFVMFNDVFNTELDIYLGQYQVSDPLFKRELRLTYQDYQVYRMTPGDSRVNLTYDRGVMMTWGFANGPGFVFQILNGNGIGEANEFRVYDDDKYKNFALHASQDVGEFVNVGLFGYYGKEAESGYKNEMWMLGPNGTIGNDKIELNGQYMLRRDDNPWFTATKPSDEIETQGGLAEVVYMPDGDRSTWYLTGLYNWVDSDDDLEDYEAVTAHVGWVLRTNFRLIAENTYDIEQEENQFVVGFISAF
ncbi:hypothetical protein GF420_00780 [candidate division GN15 bacterium]|nr:hypothetical protein [candidate division GN15 bacterium]